MDDSPLWDEGVPVESPELNTYLVMQMTRSPRSRDPGLDDDAVRWRAHAKHSLKKSSPLLDEQAGVFWATHDHKPIHVLTPFNLYPLMTGRLPTQITQRLIAHLTNRSDSGVLSSTHGRLNDPKFNPDQMWRARLVNINHLFVEGWRRQAVRACPRAGDKTLAW